MSASFRCLYVREWNFWIDILHIFSLVGILVLVK